MKEMVQFRKIAQELRCGSVCCPFALEMAIPRAHRHHAEYLQLRSHAAFRWGVVLAATVSTITSPASGVAGATQSQATQLHGHEDHSPQANGDQPSLARGPVTVKSQAWSFNVGVGPDGEVWAWDNRAEQPGFTGEATDVINRCVAELPPGGGTIFLTGGV